MTSEEKPFIGDVLKKRRGASGLTQEAMAHLCNVQVKTIVNLENGTHLPHLVTFAKYAVAANIEPHQLMKEIEETTNFLEVIRRDVDKNR